MTGLVRFVLALCVALVLGVGASAAAERGITPLPGTDLPGFDYSVLKGTTLQNCEAACQGDNICRAFTFNTKARWCFLKSGVGQPAPFAGASSGKISMSPSPEAIADARKAELPFPPDTLLQEAREFAAGLPQSDTPPSGAVFADLVASGDASAARANPAGAMTSYRQALALVQTDPAVWMKLAGVALAQGDAEAKKPDSSTLSNLAQTATDASLNAFLMAETPADRARDLGALAHALELRQMWKEAIATYRTSLSLVDDAALEARLDAAVAQHGFRVTANSVDADAASPRICATFSDALPAGGNDLSAYVAVEGAPQIAVETEQSQICITGVEHGRRYHVRLRAGLPSADGEKLIKDVDLNLYVPDRKPFVAFANNAYVMPAGLGGGLPISSVNAKTADVVIYRIGDRSIATAVRNGTFGGTLDQYSAQDVADTQGEKVWAGQVDLAQGAPNATLITAIPVGQVLPSMQPGAYVATAKVSGSNADSSDSLATQWFIVTDLGLSTVSGDDGIHAFVRSLTSAKPVEGAHLRLVAVDNEILGEATTDASGEASFAPGLARGEGGRGPQLLVAETNKGDYAFLDISKPAFDLTDRGVDGRASPGPLDLFATTERGVYRPGETVFLTALLRDTHAKAVAGLPLTMNIERPDGVVSTHEVLKDKGAGGYFAAVLLLKEAMRGAWHVKLYADPKAAPLSDTSFLVEDFEPQRLAFDVTAPDGPIAVGTAMPITVAAKYLYGATAPNLAIQADTVVRATSSLAGYPGYSFGRLDDDFANDRESLGTIGTTDEQGNATADVVLPQPTETTRPLEADILLSLVDTNGRTVEHSLTRPVLADVDRIGIKPNFSADGLPEGSEAGFNVIAVDPSGKTIAKPGLSWTLSRVETNYQWFREGSAWKWEAVTTTSKVANGTVDALASGPATVSATVRSGRYRLEVDSAGDKPSSTTYEFYAGYYYPDAGTDTPDKLTVALDKKAYRAGDTAHLRLDPQFAGTALVMVVDDRIIDMKAVDVPAGGTTVDLPVTDQWSPGAYVTATLYRPASAAEKRMPSRALGLAFADVDPGNLKLDVGLDAPKETLPRQVFTAKINLGNVAAGQKAYVAVAAVDLGILNLTNFKTPDPDGWYFGQRQIGVDLRDLYGKLIDPTQGMPGALRSGGDEAAARLGTPPATSVLVALDSGIVDVGPDGTATVSFDMPDFNGTVRLMAMAWTDSAVGHASADVIVHDPVVVNLSPPRFLRLGDKSRLLVEINNVSGPAGTYRVSLDPGTGLSTDAPETSFDLPAGGRKSLDLSLTGAAIGDQPLKLTVTGPTGNALVKQLTLGVRAASAAVTTKSLISIPPGATIRLDKSRFAGLVPHSATLMLAVGPIARLDVPGLLYALDRYPYGCAEQVTSRALPLLYLNEVAQMVGLGTDDALRQRVKDAIADLLSKQTSSGAFGLWGPEDDGDDDLWLDSYVTEFLLRAKKEGYDVPKTALDMALDNLGNRVSSAPDFSDGGEDIAYALYDLARGGRAAIGDLRYYFEARLNNFGSPLAKAQLGAALALYGDRTRSASAFAAAVEGLNAPDDPHGYRTDYGSRLRDMAGVVALAAEFSPSGIDVAALTQKLAGLRDLAKYTSTQEDAWTLVAASSLAREAGKGSVTIDGQALTGSVYRRYDQEHFDTAPVTIVNNGNTPTEASVSLTGIPAVPPPASSQGFVITRAYFKPDGSKADLTEVHQNDRFVVVLSINSTALGSGQYVVADPLPGGFEIENPDLAASGDTSDMSWLKVDAPKHTEARTDQYVAAFQYGSQTPSFSTAYMVRAVSPGAFVLPGATVEDMYRPELRGNTDAGRIEIGPPGP
ncbi:MAG TPA: MG2 domain-containing protein [Devosiaceae bacterium]|nr:MG2 domain-containing protein [Devosiaceae bacterium]